MIPKYPFRVIIWSRLGERLQQQSHNYETLPGAMTYRDLMLRKPMVTRVELVMVLDETTRNGASVQAPIQSPNVA